MRRGIRASGTHSRSTGGWCPSRGSTELSRLWDSILDIFDREPNLLPAPLLDALHPWVHPNTVVLGRGLDDEAFVEIRRIAARVIARLAEIFGDRPGVLRSLKEHAERGNIPVPIDLPDYFAVLFPKRWDGSDEDDGLDGWQRRADAGVRRLAEQLPKESTDDIAAFIVGADSQAATAGITYPRHTPHLARRLAADSTRPKRCSPPWKRARRPLTSSCRSSTALLNSSVRVGKQPSNVCSLRIGRLGCLSRSH